MADDRSSPHIIECQIRLHHGPPAATGGAPTWAEWSQTAAGNPVTFEAIASPATGGWNGPLSPGVEIAAPAPLPEPYWTVFLPGATGRPVVSGPVGRPLDTGECFNLPPGRAGVWTEGAVFDGAIVTD